MRRLLNALISVREAALELRRAAAETESVRAERRTKFRIAQQELERAGVLPFTIRGSPEALKEVPTLLDSLEASDADQRPLDVGVNAARALQLIATQTHPKPMPKWFRRLVARVYGYRSQE
jgi:hypothetical protein